MVLVKFKPRLILFNILSFLYKISVCLVLHLLKGPRFQKKGMHDESVTWLLLRWMLLLLFLPPLPLLFKMLLDIVDLLRQEVVILGLRER